MLLKQALGLGNYTQNHVLQVHDKRVCLTVHQFKTWFNLKLPSNILREVSQNSSALHMKSWFQIQDVAPSPPIH